MQLFNVFSLVIPGVVAVALNSRSQYTGVATFNDYANQTNTVCGQFAGQSGTYGAAIGDLSADIWFGDKCSGTADDFSQCSGVQAVSGYQGPSCPTTTCGTCFQVCNAGGYGGAQVDGVGACITAQVIDVCPSESADNYCKTNVPADERCGSTTNALDIDQSAYQVLAGTEFVLGVTPNLYINITPTSC